MAFPSGDVTSWALTTWKDEARIDVETTRNWPVGGRRGAAHTETGPGVLVVPSGTVGPFRRNR